MNKTAPAAIRGIAASRPISWRTRVATLAVGLLFGSAALAVEPAVELIVPFGPGGGADLLARHCAPALQSALSAPVQVQNVPGATGNDAVARLLAAPSDGRTVAVLTADTYATLAYANPRWKASDVMPLAVMTRQPSALFVAASSRYASWRELEQAARAQPRALRVAITGFGSPDYIALQQLAARHIEFTPVPLANPQERYRAVLDGQADAVIEQAGDVRSLVDGGQLKPILEFGPAHPEAGRGAVATSGDLGLGNGVAQFRAFVVKAGTPAPVAAALAAAFERIGASPEFKGFLQTQHAAADSFVPASDARAFMERELAQMKKVVDALPMHAQYLFDDKPPQELPTGF